LIVIWKRSFGGCLGESQENGKVHANTAISLKFSAKILRDTKALGSQATILDALEFQIFIFFLEFLGISWTSGLFSQGYVFLLPFYIFLSLRSNCGKATLASVENKVTAANVFTMYIVHT
jgi:hypothetical protein